MTKEDTNSAGLMSKMVKFIRNPATSWTELDKKETDRDEAVSKLLLKEMIERKRRRDFVRKREFDMLREIRMRKSMGLQKPSFSPSFLHSSQSKLHSRAMTIKKIDEIEAQMSMQWWKIKHGMGSSLRPLESSNFSASVIAPPPSVPPTAPLAMNGFVAPRRDVDPARLSVDFEITQSSDLQMLTSGNTSLVGALGSNFTDLMAVDFQEVAHDAELEEASISFANSDDVAAEAALLDMVAPNGSRAGQSEVWMALFDLYRATDNQEKFENAAIKFVQKFDRSAPQWFSMPAMVKQLGAPEAKAPVGSQTADWICSSTMGIQTVAALKAALAKAPMPWRLNWTNLKTIEANAVEPLFKVFAAWAAQPVQLRFIGGAHFLQILQNATPSGERATSQDSWQLRMEALRVMHRPDEFELTALDFCVTYEVSPPAWEVARCEYKPMDNQGQAISGNTIIGDVYRDSVPSSLSVLEGDTHMDNLSSQMSSLLSVELSGQIEGDAVAMLEKLETKLLGADIMMISCAKLIRVDFSAAGTLLNWVSARQAENRAVQFTDVNRLVAAFFNVIGITEHAKVSTRRD
jgi:ABC-type transporter Mla MlaB component